MIEGEATPVRSIDARETLLSPCLAAEAESGQRVGKGASLVLIDCRPLTRQCLTRWLQDGSPDWYIIPIATPADLLNATNLPSAPTTIIFSIGASMVRDRDVLAQMTLLRRHLSWLPLVLLSDRDDIDDIVAAMEQGVRGYLPTSLEPSEAAAALRCVMAGGTFVPVSAMIKLVQDRPRSRPASEPATNPTQQLTPRESEVLARLRQGKPNKIIAHELRISENTVKVFVRRIMMKLDATNRTELAGRSCGRADSAGGG